MMTLEGFDDKDGCDSPPGLQSEIHDAMGKTKQESHWNLVGTEALEGEIPDQMRYQVSLCRGQRDNLNKLEEEEKR
jgi:hypothetical protein